MTKTKSTKRALLLSALSLLMCVSMLIGSTFAWFTDSVTSAGNIIKSGTLDVTMEWKDATTTGSVQTYQDASQNAIFNYDKWEPGYVEAKNIKIGNVGTLALKYQLNIAANGEVSKLADVIDVYYAEGEITLTDRTMADLTKIGTLTEVLAAISTTASGDLIAGESDYVTLALKMQETAGNEYQNLAIGSDFSVQLLATQLTHESDSFDNQYDLNAATYVDSAEEAQTALDNAKKGDVIVLASGNYGTLKIRTQEGVANTTTGHNYVTATYTNESLRTVEDVTIVGAAGATIDAIELETGYSNGALHLVDIKNLTVDGVTFTDAITTSNHGVFAPILVDLQWARVDGLTVKNCKLTSDKSNDLALVYIVDKQAGGSTFETYAKNVTIEGNTVDGIRSLCELRETENVTITGNTIRNTSKNSVQMSANTGKTYSGDVTITGNTAYGINGRFVRMGGAGDANVVIKDNTITNYLGEDADYIKVTDSNGTPVIAPNTLASIGVKDAATAQAALDNAVAGTTIQLQPGVNYGTLYIRTVEGVANTTTGHNYVTATYANESLRTVEDVTIVGASGATIDAIKLETSYLDGALHLVDIKNLTVDGVTFTDAITTSNHGVFAPILVDLQWARVDGLTVKNCKLTSDQPNKLALVYIVDKQAGGSTFETYAKNVTIEGNTVKGTSRFCEFRGTTNLKIANNNIDSTSVVSIILATNPGETYTNVTVTGNTFTNITGNALDYVTSVMPADFEANVIANNTGLTDTNVQGW